MKHLTFTVGESQNVSSNEIIYGQSSGYNSLDLCCFEVVNAPHKNIKNIIEAVKLDHCDQELL